MENAVQASKAQANPQADRLEWGNAYPMPPHGNMMVTDAKDFVERGTRLFEKIEQAIKDYLPAKPISHMQILDFGCGVGRIALPFFYKYRRPTRCVDLSVKAIRYLQSVIPDARPHVSRKKPPLEFYADGLFDVVYSVSVFTHLEPTKAEAWLRELHRVLKPGGLALISTSSHSQLERHHANKERKKLWHDVTVEQFERDGIVFRGTEMKGMGGIYGCTIHTPEWVKENWGKVFDFRETRVRALGGSQDLNVMVKAG